MSDKTSDKKASDALLSCPFCGCEAEFYRTPVKTNGGWCDSVVVRCKNCEARTNRILYDASKHKNDNEYDEASAAWNQRKPLERIVERLEERKEGYIEQYGKTHTPESRSSYEAYEDAIDIVKEEGLK